MENHVFINTVEDKILKKEGLLRHEKALAQFESHREMYEQYAGHGLNVEPSPEGLDTFAFNLETDTIYLNGKFYEDLGYPEVSTSFATFHEIEHFREKVALLKERDGVRIFGEYLNKLDEKVSQYSGAYGVMDNCIADIRENGAVVSRTHEGFDEVEKKLYRDVQFPSVDFNNDKEEYGRVISKKQPLHIQFSYTVLNEYRTGRNCVTDARVRKAIEGLQKTTLPNGKVVDLLSLMTAPLLPMSKRMAIQDNYVWPRVLELLEEDMKEAENKQSDKKDKDGSKGEDKDGKPNQQSGSKENKPEGKPNPNEVFKESYSEAKKLVPNAVPIDKQKEALKKWVEENGDENKKLAERLGVKVEDLKKYKDIVKKINAINPETQESAIDDLETLIRRIISQRLKEKHAPKYPVEDGDELVDPAGWLAEVRGGNLEPKVWEDTEIKLKKDKKFGEVEITLVCDRSGSMKENGAVKLREQQKALVLFMEALKRFNDILDEEEISVEKSLSIKSEIYTFQSDGTDGTPIKKMGKVLSEKDRIESCAVVSSTGGSTTDFVPLEAIHKSISEESLEKIKEGELKKIVIVFTDGESDDPVRVQNILKGLKEKGVIVVGVGVTKDGKSALTTYAPQAVLAEQAEKLSVILGDILKEHLEGI